MFFIIFSVIIKIVSATNDTDSKLIDEAVRVTNKYYERQFVTSVVWDGHDPDGVNEFLAKYRGCVLITPMFVNVNDIIHTKQVAGYERTIFFASKSNKFEKFMNLINQKLRSPIRLILVYKHFISDIAELSAFTEIAWKNNLADIVIISKKINNEISFSTYFPYNNGVCGNFIPVKLKRKENMFPKKFNNFNKCPIRASGLLIHPFVDVVIENGTVTKLDGYDGIALTLIRDTINATLEFKEVSEASKSGFSTNGTASSIFYDLMYNKSDILIPAGILTLGRYSVTQTSHIYHDVEIRWIGPKRREIYHWIKILMPFLDTTTPFLCLAFTLFVITAVLISRQKQPEEHKKRSMCFLTYTLLLGQTTKRLTKVPLFNVFFLLWIWFCFIVRIEYQGDLVESLQNQILEAPFESLAEAIKEVDGFGGTEVVLDFYRDTHLEDGYKILALTEINAYVHRIADGERFLLATDTFFVKRILNSIQILGAQISTTWTCFYMRRGWPAASYIDSIILRLEETGLLEKIHSMDDDEFVEDSEEEQDTRAHALDMTILSACLYGLGFMWMLCSIILVLEMIYHKLSRKRYHQV
ncbi:uncharacterized protein LOC142974901 [Anticarsia gemmatalis]|uniref:uncharacterized protein LOC142974901 n=1 Tax=Anticarsia gemmatalis TaxID=129554 RepID=UPI003F76702D